MLTFSFQAKGETKSRLDEVSQMSEELNLPPNFQKALEVGVDFYF